MLKLVPRRSIRGFASSCSTSTSLPPVPFLPNSLHTVEEMRLARAWIEAFDKMTTDQLPRTSYEISYSRSSGPGGQNVNKISSKALLRFPLSPPPSFLPTYLLFALAASPYHTASPLPLGSLLTSSSAHRTAPLNLIECFKKLKETFMVAARVGIKGETSVETKKRVISLIEGDKRRNRMEKEGRKSTKSGRRDSGKWND